jgi:death-on-curing family protein
MTCVAAYAFSIVKVHAFVDENNRAAFATIFTFLRLKGWHFRTAPTEVVKLMEDLSSDKISEEKFRNWLKQNSPEII